MAKAGEWARYEQQMSLLASRLASVPGGMGTGIAAQFKDAADQAAKVSQQYREFGLGQQKRSPEEQEAERMGMTTAELGAHKEQLKKDTDAFEKKRDGILETANTASESRHMMQLGKAIVNSPEFHSGVMQPTTNEVKRWIVALGGDPNAALTPEVFNKLVSNVLTEQIKALGNAGVGRVLMTEVQNMQKGIASGSLTPASNLLLLELLDRTYKRQMEIADQVSGLSERPGRQQVALQKMVRDYNSSHPFFSDDELHDMRLIAPPTIKGRQDLASWGIKPGNNTPVIWGGAPFVKDGKLVQTGQIMRF
jgi:hypothetical protein